MIATALPWAIAALLLVLLVRYYIQSALRRPDAHDDAANPQHDAQVDADTDYDWIDTAPARLQPTPLVLTPAEERDLWRRSGGNWWPEGFVPPHFVAPPPPGDVPGQPPKPARTLNEFVQQLQQRTRARDAQGPQP